MVVRSRIWSVVAGMVAAILLTVVAYLPAPSEPDTLTVTVLPVGSPAPSPTSTSTTTASTVLLVGEVGNPKAERGQWVQVTPTDPPDPIRSATPARTEWGHNGTTISGRCTQWEPLLELLAPSDGWDVGRMSRLMNRESACCPQLEHADGVWRQLQGGDRGSGSCRFSHVAERTHRSDVGLLQINGINYNPARCGTGCVVSATLVELGDPVVNVRAAAALCAWWRNAGSSCYRPWS